MLCPVCQTDLQIAERQGIEIDYCARCRGIWLDRGELDKIIERLAAPAAEVRPRKDRDDDDDRRRSRAYEDRERDDHPKRRKSFFTELFDFD